MKLKLKDKLEIIELYEKEYSSPFLSKKFNVAKNEIKRIERY